VNDIFSVVCLLDLCMDALKELGYGDEVTALKAVSDALTGSVVLRIADPPVVDRQEPAS
jgi:hypothetical protein